MFVATAGDKVASTVAPLAASVHAHREKGERESGQEDEELQTQTATQKTALDAWPQRVTEGGGNRCAPRDVRRRPAKILHRQICRTSQWHKRPRVGTDTAADACGMLVGVVCAPGFSLETTSSAPKVRRRHALAILEETCGKPARFCRQRS